MYRIISINRMFRKRLPYFPFYGESIVDGIFLLLIYVLYSP